MTALAIVVGYATAGSTKFEPAAARRLARLALEGREVGKIAFFRERITPNG
jgi:hypothetical protein